MIHKQEAIKVFFPFDGGASGCMGESMWVDNVQELGDNIFIGILRNDPFGPGIKHKWGDQVKFKINSNSPYQKYEAIN